MVNRHWLAPGAIEGPFCPLSQRQLLWRWMRRALALMAAVAIVGFALGYLAGGPHA